MMTYEQLAQAYAQACRERDMAISQLTDIGAGYAEKMDDFERVVRCRDCIFCYHDADINNWKCTTYNGMKRDVEPNEYCSYGEKYDG